MARTKHRDIADNFIFDDTVTTADLQTGSVTSTKLAEGAVDSAGKIGDNAVTTAKITDNNITTAKILAGNITSSKLAEGVIDSAGKLGDNVVTSAKILDGSISSTKIASGAIDSAGLVADNAITGAKLANDITIGNDLTVTNDLTITGTTSIVEAIEKVTIDTSTADSINFDVLTQAVLYLDTNQTANRTINFRGNVTTSLDSVMTTGESMTFAVLLTNGVTPYYLNNYRIDGDSINAKWTDASIPSSGSASSIDVYGFTIIKTGGGAFTTLASKNKYG